MRVILKNWDPSARRDRLVELPDDAVQIGLLETVPFSGSTSVFIYSSSNATEERGGEVLRVWGLSGVRPIS